MPKIDIVLENLKEIKDYWVKTSLESLEPNSDLIWSEKEKQYRCLASLLKTSEEKELYGELLDEIILGVIHSILVMIDGGDKVADSLNLDLIDADSKESLKGSCALHEAFIEYLL